MKRVIVCGLGYAGLSFLRSIKDISSDLEIVAIDQNPFHYLQPEVYEYIAHEKLLSEIIVDLFSLTYGLSKNIQFLKDKVIDIDFDKNLVVTENIELKYDYLILSLGSRTFFPPIEGLREYSSGVKTLDRAMKFKQFFEKSILRKIKDEGICPINFKDSFNIVIGGGGLAGVEIAAEMAYFQRKLFSQVGCKLSSNMDIVLVEAFPSILYGLDEFLVETAEKRLKELGVNIITGKKITKVSPKEVVLETGDSLKSDFLIWTGGIVASSVLQKLNIPKNKKHQAIVDEYFRVKEIDNVFAIGDCAEIKSFETGKILPATAQIAIQSGKIVASHIKNLILDKPLKKEFPEFKGILTALGGKYAAGIIKDKIKIKGLPAYYLKQTVFKLYRYSLKREI